MVAIKDALLKQSLRDTWGTYIVVLPVLYICVHNHSILLFTCFSLLFSKLQIYYWLCVSSQKSQFLALSDTPELSREGLVEGTEDTQGSPTYRN